MTNHDKFTQRLIFAMREKNIKQITLAERTGISRAQISEYVHGRYIPKQDKIYLLASVLNVEPTWLMGYDTPMQIEKPQNYREVVMNEILEMIELASESDLIQFRGILKVILDKK